MRTYTNPDLHCHSTFSDGTLTPQALAARAHVAGVDLWALTDHDEISGQPQAIQAAHRHGMDYLTGVEISVTFEDHTVHIVGLGFEPDDPALRDGLAAIRASREPRARAIAAQLQEAGIANAWEGAMQYVSNPALISRTHFARFLVNSGVCRDTATVFRHYLTPGHPGYVPHAWAALEQAVGWIRHGGGMAVIAHPERYRLTSAQKKRLYTQFKRHGGLGIEVTTGSHNTAQARKAAAAARATGLLASRGSDFHSPTESRTDLGAVAALPQDLTPIWTSALQHRIRTAH